MFPRLTSFLFRSSAGVAGIEIGRRLLPPLRRHLCRIRLPEDAARTQLLALLVVLGLARAAVVDLTANAAEALVKDLPAGLVVGAHWPPPREGSSDVWHPVIVIDGTRAGFVGPVPAVVVGVFWRALELLLSDARQVTAEPRVVF